MNGVSIGGSIQTTQKNIQNAENGNGQENDTNAFDLIGSDFQKNDANSTSNNPLEFFSSAPQPTVGGTGDLLDIGGSGKAPRPSANDPFSESQAYSNQSSSQTNDDLFAILANGPTPQPALDESSEVNTDQFSPPESGTGEVLLPSDQTPPTNDSDPFGPLIISQDQLTSSSDDPHQPANEADPFSAPTPQAAFSDHPQLSLVDPFDVQQSNVKESTDLLGSFSTTLTQTSLLAHEEKTVGISMNIDASEKKSTTNNQAPFDPLQIDPLVVNNEAEEEEKKIEPGIDEPDSPREPERAQSKAAGNDTSKTDKMILEDEGEKSDEVQAAAFEPPRSNQNTEEDGFGDFSEAMAKTTESQSTQIREQKAIDDGAEEVTVVESDSKQSTQTIDGDFSESALTTRIEANPPQTAEPIERDNIILPSASQESIEAKAKATDESTFTVPASTSKFIDYPEDDEQPTTSNEEKDVADDPVTGSEPQQSNQNTEEDQSRNFSEIPKSSECTEDDENPITLNGAKYNGDTASPTVGKTESTQDDNASAGENISPAPATDVDSSTTLSDAPLAAQQSSELTASLERSESLEKELQAAKAMIDQLKKKEEEDAKLKDNMIVDLQKKLQSEMVDRAEAQDVARRSKDKAEKILKQFSTLQEMSKEKVEKMKDVISGLIQTKNDMEKELVDIREERDEQARKESSLTTRLNNAIKKVAVKANASDHYEGQVDHLESQLGKCKEQLVEANGERKRCQKEVNNWRKYSEERTKQLEGAYKKEKKLNEERKRKMNSFVEAKTEEVRATKADNISLQAELDQTTRSLKDFNQRYKQLHGQWVQGQTRTRELQRDMAKMKNDSEKMSKVGGTLEARLSRSAQSIEDHKNKRLAAKNELMAVIAQLEEEKKVNTKLKDYIRSKFTPKVLSQNQTMQENLDSFEAGLKKLSLRFGREMPPNWKDKSRGDNLSTVLSNDTIESETTMKGLKKTISDVRTVQVLSKLEDESQRVNQHISDLTASVDQLNSLLVAPTTKGCVGAIFNNF
jgi:hypothetical protein